MSEYSYPDKNQIWPKPDYGKLLDKGIPKEAVYMQFCIREHFRQFEPDRLAADEVQAVTYQNLCEQMRDLTEQLESAEDMEWICAELYELCELEKDENAENSFKVPPDYYDFISPALVEDVVNLDQPWILAKEADKSVFFRAEMHQRELKKTLGRPLFSDYEKKMISRAKLGANRSSFKPELIEKGDNARLEQVQELFGLKIIDFGEQTSLLYRQAALDLTLESLADLSILLGVHPSQIGLTMNRHDYQGNLSLFIGMEQTEMTSSDTLGQYHGTENLIQLADRRGNGSLAHEFAHALDLYLGAEVFKTPEMYATARFVQTGNSTPVPELSELLNAMLYRPDGRPSEYLQKSLEWDRRTGQMGKLYWSSAPEMFARAFACFVHDKMDEKGISNTFLVKENENCPEPEGFERKQLNLLMEDAIKALRDKGILKSMDIGYDRLGKSYQMFADLLHGKSSVSFDFQEPEETADYEIEM